MSGEEDRLSALGNDILRRILYFSPAKEAASTSVLSRQWGSLWRSSGAVNLAVRVKSDRSQFPYSDQRRKDCEEAFSSHRDAFVRAAEAALGAATTRISRFTLHLEANQKDAFDKFLSRTSDLREKRDMVGALLSHPAARYVEELRLTIHDPSDKRPRESEVYHNRGYGVFALSSLPSSETLRELELTRCWKLTLPEPVAFPRLAKLQLRFCVIKITSLQFFIDAAPGLATVHLDSVLFWVPDDSLESSSQRHMPTTDHHSSWSSTQHHTATREEEAPTLRLRCSAATTLVLALCRLQVKDPGVGGSWAIEIEAPKLRYFRYKGITRPFLLRIPAPDMFHVDLHFIPDDDPLRYDQICVDTTLKDFWQFVNNISYTKILKIKVLQLEHIAAIGKAKRTEHLCLFPNVKCLELEGVYDPMSKKAAVAIANLLRCCPALCEIQLRLSTEASYCEKDSSYIQSVMERKDRLNYEKSVDQFMRRRSSKPMIFLNDQYDEVSDIPGLRGRSFTCLQSSLRRVAIKFQLEESNCLGIRLIRFFAENAMVLEHMALDSGTRRQTEHMNLNIERWVASDSSKVCLKRKNIADSSWECSRNPKRPTESATDPQISTNDFTVVPLRR